MPITRAIIRIFLLIINVIVALSLLAATVAGLVDPNTLAVPALLGLAFEWLAVANAVMCVLWLPTSRKRYALISAFVLACAIIPMRRTFNLSSKNENTQLRTEGLKSLKVLSYNTLRLGKRKPMDENLVIDYIKQVKSDVVFLQEYEESLTGKFPKRADIQQALSDYPYSMTQFRISNKQRNFGVAIYSKYPLINKHNIEFESTYNGAFRCDMLVGRDTIRLICAHLESNQITGSELDQPVQDAMKQNTDSLSASTRHIIDKLRKAYQLRSHQAQLIAEEIKASPYKTIVCGDFNDVPVSYTYHTIAHNLSDAFAQAGPRGLGHTFKRKWLHVRIDYILYSKDIIATDMHIDRASGSDHYPVRATLKF